MLGFKRITPVSCKIEQIPGIDLLVISHNQYAILHNYVGSFLWILWEAEIKKSYDHLNVKSVTAISKQFPQAYFFVPLGLKKWLKHTGIHQATELDWWEERDVTVRGISARIGYAIIASCKLA